MGIKKAKRPRKALENYPESLELKMTGKHQYPKPSFSHFHKLTCAMSDDSAQKYDDDTSFSARTTIWKQ